MVKDLNCFICISKDHQADYCTLTQTTLFVVLKHPFKVTDNEEGMNNPGPRTDRYTRGRGRMRGSGSRCGGDNAYASSSS